MKKILFSVMAAGFLLSACNRAEDAVTPTETPTPGITTGKVSGKVMSNNGSKPIGGALVFTFDDQHKLYYAYSDAQGNFTLDAPAGQRTIHIQTGGGSNFRTEVTANISKDQPLVLAPATTKLTQVASIAYVKGSFDKIEDIIASLGYTATQLTTTQLQDLNTMAQYDIIFMNCGSRGYLSQTDYQAIESNMATFVTNGGSLYASDWDVAYLVGGTNNTQRL